MKHIKDEIAQEHQVLIIYPLVEESTEVPYQSLAESRGFWEEKFDAVYVTHGKDKQKEEVLLEFREKGNILLATTVVEVGISLPRLTLINPYLVHGIKIMFAFLSGYRRCNKLKYSQKISFNCCALVNFLHTFWKMNMHECSHFFAV